MFNLWDRYRSQGSAVWRPIGQPPCRSSVGFNTSKAQRQTNSQQTLIPGLSFDWRAATASWRSINHAQKQLGGITSQWTSCCIGLIIFQTEARRAVALNKRAFELGKAWHFRRTISLGKHTQVNCSSSPCSAVMKPVYSSVCASLRLLRFASTQATTRSPSFGPALHEYTSGRFL